MDWWLSLNVAVCLPRPRAARRFEAGNGCQKVHRKHLEIKVSTNQQKVKNQSLQMSTIPSFHWFATIWIDLVHWFGFSCCTVQGNQSIFNITPSKAILPKNIAVSKALWPFMQHSQHDILDSARSSVSRVVQVTGAESRCPEESLMDLRRKSRLITKGDPVDLISHPNPSIQCARP